jgi:hypothetical protein
VELDWAALQKEADDVLLPDGDYTVIVTDAQAVTSSTGKPMIKVKFAVAEGPKKDRPLWSQLTLSPENPMALRMWFTQLAAFGLGAEFFATKPSMEGVAAALKSRGVVVTVGRREFAGSDRNNIEKIVAYVPSGPIPSGMVLGPPSAGPSPTSSGTPVSPVAPTATPVAASTSPGPTPPPTPAF